MSHRKTKNLLVRAFTGRRRIRHSVDTWEVKQELSDRGYTDLVIQMGFESYTPTKSRGEDGSLAVDFFTFSSSIADYLRSASLLISHTGP
ncbi:uncharacterized protein LOC142611059 isoform X3 [Castanea sativa]|uniref:uncharacterized protein LOC142611059 isoform X3 n=1 Tax=Castanea sativa TaxID=21020 RepID=UPI003F65001E